MTIQNFLSARLGRIVLWLAAMLTAYVFLLITGTQSGVLVIILMVWGILATAVQMYDFIKCDTRIKELEAVMDGLDQKYLFAECVPESKDIYEQKLFALIRRSGKAMIGSVSDARSQQREYREYIESWVHEIKTPMTAAMLLSRSAEPQLRRRIEGELAQIENHVERALFYARADSPEKDFIIRQTDLAEITAQAIARHRSLLIQNGVRIEAENLDYTVYTDEKWVSFLLGQLLQNAVRYRREAPFIILSAKQLGRRVQMDICDNGMGIPPHELPRIFERGFTGSNGRACGGATGIGLYLCRKLAVFLEIDLRVNSVVGQGTDIVLTFPAKENLSKV